MFSREEFKQQVKRVTWNSSRDFTADNSPLWNYERDIPGPRPEWFVCVKQHSINVDQQSGFWTWCNSHLNGRVICYLSSSEHGEWWGFTDPDDVVLWLLKWS